MSRENPTNIERAYEAGRKVGLEHTRPSRETLDMIHNLDETIKLNCLKMENLEKKVDEGFKTNTDQHKEIMTILKESLEQKANVWVEKVVVWLLIVMATTGIGALAFLIKETLYK